MGAVLYGYTVTGFTRQIMPEYDLLEGEVVFDHVPTEAELAATFPDFVSQAWRDFQQQAKWLLADTDLVAIRCFTTGIAFPSEWRDYIEALRLIVRTYSGDATSALPERPEYPLGS